MSRKPKTPIFLQRTNYRQQRLRDAAKLMPIIGTILLALPLAWATEGPDEKIGSNGLIYVFGVWVLLIIGTALLTSCMRRGTIDDDDRPPKP